MRTAFLLVGCKVIVVTAKPHGAPAAQPLQVTRLTRSEHGPYLSRVKKRWTRSSALLAALLIGCRSPGPADGRDAGSSSDPSAAQIPSPSGPPAAASMRVLEAPHFDVFLRGVDPVCSRSMRLEKLRDKWLKSYDVRAPAVAPEALEAHFRDHAKELGLEVAKPLAADLFAGKDGTLTSAGLSVEGAMVTMTTELVKPELDAELRRAASEAPEELLGVVAALGGAGAITRLVTSEGADLGRSIDVTLARGASIDEVAFADAAKKIGLVAKSEGAFGSRQDPSPGSWYIGLSRDETSFTITAAKPVGQKAATCGKSPFAWSARPRVEASHSRRGETAEEGGGRPSRRDHEALISVAARRGTPAAQHADRRGLRMKQAPAGRLRGARR